MTELTDKETNRVIIESGIPAIYARPDASLSNCGPAGERIKEWLHGGGYRELRKAATVVEIVSENVPPADAFFCMARACILKAIAVRVLHVREMLEGEALDPEVWTLVDGARVLFFEDFVPHVANELSPAQRATLEWFAARWVMDGKAAVFLHERALADSEFSGRFRARMREHHKLLVHNV